MEQQLADAFRTIFEHIEKDGIKRGVDRKGLDQFVDECALLAAMTGAVTGFGGAITMIVGVPADILNNIVQQFRVTLAVIYHRRGSLTDVDFSEFMKIVGVSLGVEVGAALTGHILRKIGTAILSRMTASTAARVFPVVSSVVCSGVNWGFIKGIAESVKQLDLRPRCYEIWLIAPSFEFSPPPPSLSQAERAVMFLNLLELGGIGPTTGNLSVSYNLHTEQFCGMI